MTLLLASLSEDVMARLRDFAAAAEDINWPTHVAQARGWRTANEIYHAQQRTQGRSEMAHLLAALNLRLPLSLPLLQETFQAAITVFLHTEATTAAAQADGEGVRLALSRCPLFDRFTDPSWAGITACGCFSRFDGWYEALGVPADVELVTNRKWDDPDCQVILRLPSEHPTDSLQEPASTSI